MRKLSLILLNTILFCIVPVTNLFALSKEAETAIEKIRAELEAREKAEQQETPEVYIPGRELSAALVRYKLAVYSKNLEVKVKNQSEIKSEEKSARPSGIDVSDFDHPMVGEPVEYNNGSIVMAEDGNFGEKPAEVIDATAISANEANNIAVTNSEENSQIAHGTMDIYAADDSIESYIPGQLLQNSIMKIRRSQGREESAGEEVDKAIEEYEAKLVEAKKAMDSKEAIEKADEEIAELYNTENKPEALVADTNKKRDDEEAIAEMKKKGSKRPKNKAAKKSRVKEDEIIVAVDDEESLEALKKNTEEKKDSKEIDDEKFNEYISRYDFKMPENYRIIME